MEVEAHEKKGHRAFAKAIKSFGSHRRSNRFVCAERFASASFSGFLAKNFHTEILLFVACERSDLENLGGKDALYASDKTFVQPKQVVRFSSSCAASTLYYLLQ